MKLVNWVKSRSNRLVMKAIVKKKMYEWMHIRYAEVRIKSGFESEVEWRVYSN